MPYIKQEDRIKWAENGLDDLINGIQLSKSLVAGDLNYIITKIVHAYIELKGENYQHYNDIMGALEGVKLELYRRHIGQYEKLKANLNGDV